MFAVSRKRLPAYQSTRPFLAKHHPSMAHPPRTHGDPSGCCDVADMVHLQLDVIHWHDLIISLQRLGLFWFAKELSCCARVRWRTVAWSRAQGDPQWPMLYAGLGFTFTKQTTHKKAAVGSGLFQQRSKILYRFSKDAICTKLPSLANCLGGLKDSRMAGNSTCSMVHFSVGSFAAGSDAPAAARQQHARTYCASGSSWANHARTLGGVFAGVLQVQLGGLHGVKAGQLTAYAFEARLFRRPVNLQPNTQHTSSINRTKEQPQANVQPHLHSQP